MNLLTNLFYLLATSLMIPVMLLLLVCLVRVLLMAGDMLRTYRDRHRHAAAWQRFAAQLDAGQWPSRLVTADDSSADHTGLTVALDRLLQVAENDVLAEKVLQDCQLAWSGPLDRLRTIARTGPALGLMGTLIPLGPALVGLAAGDLQMMSSNLVIAFATTVVGLLVGTLASVMVSTRQSWLHRDTVLVTYAANRLTQLNEPESPNEACWADSSAAASRSSEESATELSTAQKNGQQTTRQGEEIHA